VCQYDDTLISFEVSVNYIFAYSVLVVTSISQNMGLVREYFGFISIFSGTIVLLHYDSKVRLYLLLFVGGLMSFLRYLCYLRIVVSNK